MAPSRKRKSDEMAAGPTTPEAASTPARKKMKITQTQKQALIDNLQLEITERARHLRAHYALQCADLRSRIQRRVNRIPMSMRTMTMGELMAKENATKEPPVETAAVVKTQPTGRANAPLRTTRKQKSSIVIAADPVTESSNESEEATTAPIPRPAPLPKAKSVKRSGKAAGGGVLSPRSHNSRTLPRSPIKGSTAEPTDASSADCQPASPNKRPPTARPTSPLKPASPLKSAAIATTSAITSSMHNILATAKSSTGRSKAVARLDSAQRTVSQASNHSATSNVTTTSTGTVVKNATRSGRGRAAAAGVKKSAPTTKAAAVATEKSGPPATTKSRAGTVRKGAAAAAASMKKAVTSSSTTATTTTTTDSAAAATGRRILRKRN